MTPLVKEVHKLTAGKVPSAIWFDVGLVLDFDGYPAPLRLPFPCCAVVCRDPAHNKHLYLFLSAGEGDAPVLAMHYWLQPSRWGRTDFVAIVMSYAGATAHQIDGEEMPAEDEVHNIAMVLQMWLTRLQTHACGAYEPAIQATFTNRRKAAEGKPPSYSWRTVVVPSMLRERAINGGTHASPRLHERRGHWRTIANGRKVWVRDCLVGDPDRGVVEKDYRVGNA